MESDDGEVFRYNGAIVDTEADALLRRVCIELLRRGPMLIPVVPVLHREPALLLRIKLPESEP